MLDSHQLNVFLAAAELLNFTHAARRLQMSQPSVSQHIQSLEQRFGQQLFVRAGRTLELSEAGATLVPLARAMVKQSQQIEELMASLQGDVFGHLLFGCSTTPGKYLLPQLLTRFHQVYPRVRITCEVKPQELSLEHLVEGRVHFALTTEPTGPLRREVETLPFMHDQINLIAPADHPWAQRHAPIEVEELLEGSFILREPESGTQRTVSHALTRHNMNPDAFDTLMVLGNSEAIALAVRAGLGVGFVSDIVISQLVPRGVARIAIRGVTFEREIYFCRHRRRPLTNVQHIFWGFLEEAGPLAADSNADHFNWEPQAVGA